MFEIFFISSLIVLMAVLLFSVIRLRRVNHEWLEVRSEFRAMRKKLLLNGIRIDRVGPWAVLPPSDFCGGYPFKISGARF